MKLKICLFACLLLAACGEKQLTAQELRERQAFEQRVQERVEQYRKGFLETTGHRVESTGQPDEHGVVCYYWRTYGFSCVKVK